MIERHHYFRLTETYATPEGRAETARLARAALSPLPGVLALQVGVPADDHAEAAWDVAITARFATLQDVERYRAHPEHRRFVDEILGPRIAVKKIWNFLLVGETSSA